MARTLTQTVLHKGRVYAAGTAAKAAKGVPDGPWWSESATAAQEESGGGDADAPFDPAKHNATKVIEHLEGVEDADEVQRILAAEATRENGVRKDIEAWVKAREAAESGGDAEDN